jgi:hypothetical protein
MPGDSGVYKVYEVYQMMSPKIQLHNEIRYNML